MSNLITNLCKWINLPPPQKAVLMSLADIADDKAHARPSQSWIGVWTGLKKTAIITAVKRLEAADLIAVERRQGKANRTSINAGRIAAEIQTMWRTGPYAERVLAAAAKWAALQTAPGRDTDGTRPPDEPDTSRQSNINKQKKTQARCGEKGELPAEWAISPELLTWAAGERPDINAVQCEKEFRSYYLSTADTRADWDEAFKGWVLRQRQPQPAPQAATIPVPVPTARDPALVKLDEDAKRAVPPPAETRARLRELHHQMSGRAG